MSEDRRSDGAQVENVPLSRGAIVLLAVAQENDTQGKIADNDALRIALQNMGSLPKLCSPGGRSGLLSLLGEAVVPVEWFAFCASLVRSIELIVEERSRRVQQGWSSRTDFDRNVYLALGQTIGAVIRKNERSVQMPNFKTEELIESLAQCQPRGLQQSLVENYIGNILQEVFDTAKVRLSRPRLPRDTEANLRKKDAHALANFVFADHVTEESIDVEALLKTLGRKLAFIREQDAKND